MTARTTTKKATKKISTPVVPEVLDTPEETLKVEDHKEVEVKTVETKKTLSIDDIALNTKKALAAMPKVKVFIPIDPMNRSLNIQEVWLNGMKYQIPMGVEYEVPEEIARIWRESYQKTAIAEGQIFVNKEIGVL